MPQTKDELNPFAPTHEGEDLSVLIRKGRWLAQAMSIDGAGVGSITARLSKLGLPVARSHAMACSAKRRQKQVNALRGLITTVLVAFVIGFFTLLLVTL
ncbi:MAG: hypothetical protein AAFU85_06650 [Planctomycetota bacterium]